MNKVITKNISEVKNHPVNEQIYTMSMSVEDLKESIQTHGQLTPITINSEGIIISGHRRVKALSELGHETVEAIAKEYASKEDEVMEIIAFNNQRKKTYTECINEITTYKEMWGKKQGERTDLIEGNEEEEKITTRKRIAIALGMSEGNIQSLEAINTNAPHLIPFISSGEYSIHGAFEETKKIMKKIAEENGIEPKVRNPKTLENKEAEEMVQIYTYHCKDCGRKFNEQK
jgi:ParB/RepB/Spo0J family partition protein